MEKISKKDYWRLAGIIILGLYFLNCSLHPGDWHFIDSVDLIIHEAGHWIFMFFGEFIAALGGSLNQVLIPAIFAAYFCLRRDLYSASILLLWVGYSIVNVSVYMGDAVKMQLPLLGGDSSTHDWNYLLATTHLLGYTDFLSSVTYATGLFLIIGAVAWGIRESLSNKYGIATPPGL